MGRLPRAFAEQSRVLQVVVAVLAPAALGAVAGVVLGLSALAYWVVSVLAAAGGLSAGAEHEGALPGAGRGVLGGVLYGACLLLAHDVSGRHAHVSLGAHPGFLVVVTGLAGCVLGALGGSFRARRVRAAR